jgi:hypothetical protein
MGLHRDPSTYSTNPVEVQVRRLIWYQICFLDLRTCEATGPRPQIRRDEYDTRFPLNVEDDDLDRAAQCGHNLTQDSKSFTPMTITRMRAECIEMYRMIWTERPKLQRKTEAGEKKTTLTGLLARIQSFRAAMEKAYLPMMSRDNPLHAVAMEMYGILSSRLYLATLHPFASSDKRKMPERLRQIMISSCIMIVEHSMNIEEQPALMQWSWYVGALHQYHSVMLLLSEMYVTAVDAELSARIWRCIDYAFELPSSLGEKEKIRFLLSELVERTGSYASIRGLRAPSDMPHAGPRPQDDGTIPWPDGSRHPYLPQVFQEEGRDAHSPQQDRSHRSPGSSGYAASNNDSPYSPYSQPSYFPSQPVEHTQGSYTTPVDLASKAPLGVIPQVDWGTIDMSAQSLSQLPHVTNSEPYSFGGFAPTPSQTVSPMPSLYDTPSYEMYGAETPPLVPGPPAGAGVGASNASPTDALINDIDWVRICAVPCSWCVVFSAELTLWYRMNGTSCLAARRWDRGTWLSRLLRFRCLRRMGCSGRGNRGTGSRGCSEVGCVWSWVCGTLWGGVLYAWSRGSFGRGLLICGFWKDRRVGGQFGDGLLLVQCSMRRNVDNDMFMERMG